MTLILVGFVADLHGSADHLFEAAPVVMRDREFFVAPGLDWDETALIPLVSGTGVPVHLIKAAHQIVPGDTVWVGGPSFVDGIKTCSFAEEDSYTIGGWESSALGFRVSQGHRRDFGDLVRRLRYRLEHGLHAALFDQLELFKGDAPGLYALYTGLPVDPDLDYQLTRALYFHGMRDEYSRQFIRSESVYALRLAASMEEFDDAFDAKSSQLTQMRLGEQTGVLAPPTTLSPRDVSLTLRELRRVSSQRWVYSLNTSSELSSTTDRWLRILKSAHDSPSKHESELPA
ncbi:hypothetical protein [Microbacterium sp. NPDC089696]|uniref:hypothetical protein n=1 Tax=Microbacterium sp. NPDC089696 TaxID=3364199 RepID=UPI003813D557